MIGTYRPLRVFEPVDLYDVNVDSSAIGDDGFSSLLRGALEQKPPCLTLLLPHQPLA